MALVVLGAGASRGASFTRNKVCLPPLNADFFTQLQRIQTSKHADVVEKVIADAVELFGANFSLTLEEYFTQVEFFLKTLGITGESRAFTIERLQTVRKNLLAGLAAVLEEALHDQQCTHHDKLVAALGADSTILSFNYDCLVDETLKRIAPDRWNARYGYAFPLKGWDLAGVDHWNPKTVAAGRTQTIKLLKLHGSINWQIDVRHRRIKLKERVYRQFGNPRFTIVPPEWNKGGNEDPVLRKIWREAATRIHREDVFAFLGFSFTPTDLHVASLFQIGVKTEHIKRLIIANPSSEVRRRTRSILERGLSSRTHIVQFASLEEFAQADLARLLT